MTSIAEQTNELNALAAEIYENDTARELIWAQAVEQAKALLPWLNVVASTWDVGAAFEASDSECLAREIAADTGLSMHLASVAAEAMQMELGHWAEDWDEQCQKERHAIWAASDIPF